jgi:hypothetical protein
MHVVLKMVMRPVFVMDSGVQTAVEEPMADPSWELQIPDVDANNAVNEKFRFSFNEDRNFFILGKFRIWKNITK